MAVIIPPSEDELTLWALLSDPSGIDLSEMFWDDPRPTSRDGAFRVYDYQWPWFSCTAKLQADRCGRSVGKTLGLTMRMCAFPLAFPGQQALVTAPGGDHLRPATDEIEKRLLDTWPTRMLMPKGAANGIGRDPAWQATFTNRTKIVSRLPKMDGTGVKGQHVISIEQDEAQDYPSKGWAELGPTLNFDQPGATRRIHGVPRGGRDQYFQVTEPGSGYTVHKYPAMYRPGWGPEEREANIKENGNSRHSPDYRRNIYGEPGDVASPVFVAARLSECADYEPDTVYNTQVYTQIRITAEEINERGLENLLDLPGTHKGGWVGDRPVHRGGAPGGYANYYGGMDIGLTSDPTEILVAGEKTVMVGKTAVTCLDLLARIHLERVDVADHIEIIDWLFGFYGTRLTALGMDQTGMGLPFVQLAHRRQWGARVFGYNFSGKAVVAVEDRELKPHETEDDLLVQRWVIEHATDHLRNELVDPGRLLLPDDSEILNEWRNGKAVSNRSTDGTANARKSYPKPGGAHTLDAARMLAAAKTLPAVADLVNRIAPQEDIPTYFGRSSPFARR